MAQEKPTIKPKNFKKQKINPTNSGVKVPKKIAVPSIGAVNTSPKASAPKSQQSIAPKDLKFNSLKTPKASKASKSTKDKIGKKNRKEKKHNKSKAQDIIKAQELAKIKDNDTNLQAEMLEENSHKASSDDKPQIKDFELDDLGKLEEILAKRKEKEEKRRRKAWFIIIALLIALFSSAGGFLLVNNYFKNLPKPQIEIVIELPDGIELMEPDPNDPDGTLVPRLMYPGDIIAVRLLVTNAPKEEFMSVFLRFSAYIEVDDAFEPFIFIPTFVNPYEWDSLQDVNGNQADHLYYYRGYLGSFQTIETISSLKIITTLNDSYQGKIVKLVLKIEVIEANQFAVDAIWGTERPESWYEYLFG